MFYDINRLYIKYIFIMFYNVPYLLKNIRCICLYGSLQGEYFKNLQLYRMDGDKSEWVLDIA